MKVKEDDLRRELKLAIDGKDSQKNCAFRLGIRENKFTSLLARAGIHGTESVLYSNSSGSYTDKFKLKAV